MSNKKENILRKAAIVILLILSGVGLIGFEPQIEDFANTYQYKLYISWLKQNNFKTDFPAGLTSEKIVKTFKNKDGRKIEVEYALQDRKIIDQRENLPFMFLLEEELEIQPYIDFLEGFIYRINASDKEFLSDYLSFGDIDLQYSIYSDSLALDVLWKSYAHKRIAVKPIELEQLDDKLKFKIITKNNKKIIITLPKKEELSEIIAKIRQREIGKSLKVSEIQQRFPDKVSTLNKPDEISVKDFTKYSLAEYISKFYSKPPPRELLNNKIKNVDNFLKAEFPNSKIFKGENKYYIKNVKTIKGLLSDIKLEVIHEQDGIHIRPSIDHDIQSKKFYLSQRENIDLSSLTNYEIDKISSSLPHLIYEHRALGSDLLNFFLIHDDVFTTLVIRSDKREIYELNSYADLLLLMNRYWENKTSFFNIKEIKKKDGHIEFKGFLIVKDNKKYDMAKIQFYLNKKFKIDMIMMILYPGEENN